jgi:hypothetical protein
VGAFRTFSRAAWLSECFGVQGTAVSANRRWLRSCTRFVVQAVHPAPSTAESAAQAKAAAHFGQDAGGLPSSCDETIRLGRGENIVDSDKMTIGSFAKAALTNL